MACHPPCVLSRFVSDSATLWAIAHQAHLFMQFSRQEYWNRLPYPPPRDLPDPGIQLVSLKSHDRQILYH